MASSGVRKQISGWVILQSPLKQSGIEFCQKQDEEFREILLNPPKYSWKCWPGFLLISYPNFPVFRLWNMPRRFQDQRLSLRGNQTKRWKRKGFCPRLHMEPVYPKSHPWNLCGAGTRRRRKLWLLSKPFIFYRCLGNLWDVFKARMPQLFYFELWPSHLDFPAHWNLNWLKFNHF